MKRDRPAKAGVLAESDEVGHSPFPKVSVDSDPSALTPCLVLAVDSRVIKGMTEGKCQAYSV
jgi:hypothetical protein